MFAAAALHRRFPAPVTQGARTKMEPKTSKSKVRPSFPCSFPYSFLISVPLWRPQVAAEKKRNTLNRPPSALVVTSRRWRQQRPTTLSCVPPYLGVAIVVPAVPIFTGKNSSPSCSAPLQVLPLIGTAGKWRRVPRYKHESKVKRVATEHSSHSVTRRKALER